MPDRILLVDDEPDLLATLGPILRGSGYEVLTATDGEEAGRLLEDQSFNTVITDLRLPGISGLEILDRVSRDSPDTTVLLITGYGTVSDAVEAMKRGAEDYLTKPVNPEELLICLDKISNRRRLEEENRYLRSQLEQRTGLGRLIGKHPRMQEIYHLIKTVAETNSTVLLTGESGTGKEMVARAVHDQGPRKEKPFVTVNCGALSSELLSSELFGHVEGAFTGAVRDRRGKFELADGGTVFLDEIGEISLAVQVQLLRVLQAREYEPLGSEEVKTADVRLLAATNRDLDAAVKEGRFREDLFYRLNVIHIRMPPLRERREDIPLLAEHFLRRVVESTGHQHVRDLQKGALDLLMAYDWPGNVRELENVIERAVVLCQGEEVAPRDLPAHLTGQTTAGGWEPREGEMLPQTIERIEREIIRQALERTGGRRGEAAKILGLHRNTLASKMRKYGLG